MSIIDDRDAFGGETKSREYIEQIWRETALDEDFFADIEEFNRSLVRRVCNLVRKKINDGASTEFRKKMYGTFLRQFETEDPDQSAAFYSWLELLNAYYLEDLDKKREFLAGYMTRVLRGKFCNNDHRSLIKAIEKRQDEDSTVWEQSFSELEFLCNQLGIK